MGFSGGGGGVLTNHTHDGAITNNGGSLAANATQFGLTDQSILVSDGTNIQELVAGSESDSLSISGGNVAWAAAGGGTYQFHEAFTQASDSSTFAITLSSAITYTDVSEIIIFLQAQKLIGDANASLSFIYNDLVSNYDNESRKQSGPTVTSEYQAGGSALIYNTTTSGINENNVFNAVIRFTPNPFIDAASRSLQMFSYWVYVPMQSTFQTGVFRAEDFPAYNTTFANLTFEILTGDIAADSTIRIYTVSAS